MREQTVEEIEDRRLEVLRKQAAAHGPMTDPAVLIEIQELSNRRHNTGPMSRRQLVNQLDYDFLMNTLAAALVRLGQVEQNQNKDKENRHWRQLVHDLFMVFITVMIFVLLILVLNR